jgi:hypothetical protein
MDSRAKLETIQPLTIRLAGMSYLDDANLVVPFGRLDLHQHLLSARQSFQAAECFSSSHGRMVGNPYLTLGEDSGNYLKS